jgi:ubiquinone/menaquinone biosynthesis C-methylase UbiE
MGRKKKSDCKINLSLWENYNQYLEYLDADRGLAFTNAFPFNEILGTPLSYNDAMMQERLCRIEDIFPKPSLKIIEIGGGYGNFCKNYKNKYPEAEYTIVDNPVMLKFVKVFLDVNNVNVNLVSPEDILTIDGEFDLFVAFSVLSEVTKDYREALLEHLLPKCKSVIIGEMQKDSLIFTEYLEKYFKHYKTTAIDQSLYPKHTLYTATKEGV